LTQLERQPQKKMEDDLKIIFLNEDDLKKNEKIKTTSENKLTQLERRPKKQKMEDDLKKSKK
jgi:hypothetical protein